MRTGHIPQPGPQGPPGPSGGPAGGLTYNVDAFTVPSVSDTVVINANDAQTFVIGQYFRIFGTVSDFLITDVTGNLITVQNLGPTFADEGTVIPALTNLFQVGHPGPVGPQGIAGPVGPLGGHRVTVNDDSSVPPEFNESILHIDQLDFAIGNWVVLPGLGTFFVSGAGYDPFPALPFVTIKNLGSPDIATPGTPIPIGSVVQLTGTVGPKGDTGIGVGPAERFIDAPAEGFSGAFRTITGGAFPSAVTWWIDNTATIKIFESVYTRDGSQRAILVVHTAYDIDGITVLSEVQDVITYSGAFEVSRERTVTP